MIWAVLPILPFLASLVLLDVVYGETLSARDWAEGGHRNDEVPSFFVELPFFNALILYITIGFFHVAICLAGAVYLVVRILKYPGDVQRCVWTVIAVLFALLIASSLIPEGQDGSGALELTYRNSCWAVVQAGVMPHLMPPACNHPGISIFAWFAALPYLSGLLAAICAAGVACTAALPLNGGTEAITDRMSTIERAFRLTVVVLVTTTLSMMLFYQLPLAVELPNDEIQTLMQDYGQGMTMFWGAVCTLTLIAIFGPAIQMLQGAETAQDDAQGKPDVLSFQGLRHQITNILAVLAPFIVGSLGPAFEILSRAF